MPASEVPSENFAFVINVLGLVSADAFTLASGHVLRRATIQEVAIIEENLSRLVPPIPQLIRNPWKTRVESGQIQPLPAEEWRYFVITFSGTNDTIIELEEAFVLAPKEIKIAFTCVGFPGVSTKLPGMIFHPDRLLNLLPRSIKEQIPFVEIQASDIEDVAKIHSRLQRTSGISFGPKRYVAELQTLQGLPQNSPLLFLGYFALLESLLTHAPDPKDPLDSITRQVKSKVALLDNRFEKHIDYSAFRGANADTVWTKMYDYRSRVAHGGAPDFSDRLAVLRDQMTALMLLRETVKATVRHSLIEPQLLTDLRNC